MRREHRGRREREARKRHRRARCSHWDAERAAWVTLKLGRGKLWRAFLCVSLSVADAEKLRATGGL